MKNFTSLTLVICTLLFSFGARSYGQNAQEARYAFDKKVTTEANGLSIVLEGKPEVILATLEKRLNPDGKLKAKSMKKGLQMYEAIVVPELSDATLNYYYKVEKTDQPTQTKVSLFLSPGNDNFWTSERYPNEIGAAKQMLEQLNTDIYLTELMQAFDVQAEVVQKALNEQKSLKKSEEDLEKEREKLLEAMAQLEKSLEKNAVDQQAQADKVLEERNKLNVIESELNNVNGRQ